jgi:hypothetical protein
LVVPVYQARTHPTSLHVQRTRRLTCWGYPTFCGPGIFCTGDHRPRRHPSTGKTDFRLAWQGNTPTKSWINSPPKTAHYQRGSPQGDTASTATHCMRTGDFWSYVDQILRFTVPKQIPMNHCCSIPIHFGK